MSTMQSAIDLAREDLNDDDKVRWPDAVLLKHANAAIRQVFASRPDLRFGNYGAAITDKAAGDSFPIPDDYMRPVADYVVARAHAVDDDAGNISRASALMTLFEKQILGV